MNETMSFCIHGAPVKLGCIHCGFSDRLDKVEKTINELHKFLTDSLAAWNLIDERINRIDELLSQKSHDCLHAEKTG